MADEHIYISSALLLSRVHTYTILPCVRYPLLWQNTAIQN